MQKYFLEKLKYLFLIVVIGLIVFLVVFKNTFHRKSSTSYAGSINHLAVIMDGNRRWAKKNNLPNLVGHEKGSEAVSVVVDFCLKRNIKYLSLYAFSMENVNRSEDEKTKLFEMVPKYFNKYKKDFLDKGIRVRIIGDRSLFPKNLLSIFNEIESSTETSNKLTLSFMFFYGGRQEILAAVKNICRKIKINNLELELINDGIFEHELWSYDLPHPELLLRTGGHRRLSNFLIWQMAYAELVFLDCFWPDISEGILSRCCDNFLKVQRNFGH